MKKSKRSRKNKYLTKKDTLHKGLVLAFMTVIWPVLSAAGATLLAASALSVLAKMILVPLCLVCAVVIPIAYVIYSAKE